MTTHALRVKHSKEQEDNPSKVPSPEPPSIPSVAPKRVEENIKKNFNAKLEEQESPLSLVESSELTSFDVDHVRGVYRFDDAEDKEEIIDYVEEEVVKDTKWHRIESHVCDHDEDNGGGCDGWKLEREQGNIPEGV